MAVLLSQYGNGVNLSNAQTGSAEATNRLARRPDLVQRGPALLKLVTAIGATPTCSYLMETSPDGLTWVPAAYIDISAQGAVGAVTTANIAAITTAVTKLFLLPVDWPWIQFRMTYSANTNVTNTLDGWSF